MSLVTNKLASSGTVCEFWEVSDSEVWLWYYVMSASESLACHGTISRLVYDLTFDTQCACIVKLHDSWICFWVNCYQLDMFLALFMNDTTAVRKNTNTILCDRSIPVMYGRQSVRLHFNSAANTIFLGHRTVKIERKNVAHGLLFLLLRPKHEYCYFKQMHKHQCTTQM